MAAPSNFKPYMQKQVNPRLGIYFSIFAAAYAALVVLLVLLEQLGYSDRWLKLIMVASPAAFAAIIGIGSVSGAPEDYFASGRRVPAILNGLIIAMTALGATGLLGITGTLYLYGADGICLGLGFLCGLVFGTVLLVPYLRKLGAYTVPSYLGQRFESRFLRMLAAALLSLPVLLVLIAELRVGATLAKSLLNVNRGSLIWPAAIAICLTVIPGGMRSLTWSNAAWSLIALIALIVPVSILSVMLTNLPLPQIAYGGLLPDLAKLEAEAGLQPRLAVARAFDLPDFGATAIAVPFANHFGQFGPTGFALAAIVIMLGVAVMPSILVRAGTTPDVYEARKSMTWAIVVLGIVLLTLPAVAVFARMIFLTEIVGKTPDRMPEWLIGLVQSGQAQVDIQSQRISLQGIKVRRDSILLIMPSLAQFPAVLTYVAASGIVAAALAGASARLVTLANMLSEDIVQGFLRAAPRPATRLTIARLALALSGAIAAWIALQWAVDPLRLVLWALSLAAATALPMLVMSIWWKRINAFGAVSGMLAGFGVTSACILSDAVLDGPAWLGIDSTLGGIFGLPVAIVVSVVASLVTPAPGRHLRDLVRDIRLPGGETIHDREIRLARGDQAA
jgi:cation/acetate symporter